MTDEFDHKLSRINNHVEVVEKLVHAQVDKMNKQIERLQNEIVD